RPGDQVLRQEADLDHRVRLPDQSARLVLRRLLGQAGDLPDAGVRHRPQEPTHHADALVPPPRRAQPGRLAIGPGDDDGPEEAGLPGVRTPTALTASRPAQAAIR